MVPLVSVMEQSQPCLTLVTIDASESDADTHSDSDSGLRVVQFGRIAMIRYGECVCEWKYNE